MAKLDFKNAFNSIRKDKMLEAVQNFAPDLNAFVHSAISLPSSLFWGDRIIQSAEGVQQVENLGPLLFCLTIHKLCSHLKSELRLFYLNDGTLGGCKDDIVQDLEVVKCEGADLGLSLNQVKSEVICEDKHTRAVVLSSLQGAKVVEPINASIQGYSIGNVSSISASLEERIKQLAVMGERHLPHRNPFFFTIP